MSTSALDLLRALEFLDKNDQPADITCWDEQTLRTSLNSYYAARAQSLDAETQGESSERAGLSAMFSSLSSTNAVSALLPAALVYSRTFADDPLFRAAAEPSDFTRASRESLGMNPTPPINRETITSKLRHLSDLAPLIRDRVICVLPVDYLHKTPGDPPVNYSEDNYASAVPEHIRDFVETSAVIQEVVPRPERGDLVVLTAPPTKPTRGIAVAFANDSLLGPGALYFLYRGEVVGKVDGSTYSIKQDIPWEIPPGEAEFSAWIQQSVNKTILNRLATVSTEMQLAEKLKATYVTESEFEGRLFALSTKEDLPRDSRASAVNFLNANLPFLDIRSAEVIASVRRDNVGLFEKFQANLLQVSSQLTGVTEDFEDKARQLYVKEIDPQIQAINTQLSKVKYQSVSSGLLAAATLGLALLKLSDLPFAAILSILASTTVLQGVGGTIPALGEYWGKKKTPAFIWSRIAKK